MKKIIIIILFLALNTYVSDQQAYLRLDDICSEAYGAQEENKTPANRDVELQTKVYWLEENSKEIIKINGKTNLPAGILLQVLLKAGVWHAGDNSPVLLDTAKILVDENRQYYAQFTDLSALFLPEYYEISVYISPNQERDGLLAEGFSDRSIEKANSYCMANVLSMQLSERRQKSGMALLKILRQIPRLKEELLDKADIIEKLKQGDGAIEKQLKQSFGLNKTSKEILNELGNDWKKWEKEWMLSLNNFSQLCKNEGIFLGTASGTLGAIDNLKSLYKQYRMLAFDESDNLKEGLTTEYTIEQIRLFRASENEIDTIEEEIMIKVIHDVIGRLEDLVSAHQKYTGGASGSGEAWVNYKTLLKSYFGSLKQELTAYNKENLFMEKSGKRDDYSQCIVLFDLMGGLIDKFDLLMMDRSNVKVKAEINDFVNVINRKAMGLLIK